MTPMVRERCILEPRFLRSKGRDAVLDRINATRQRVQSLARSHGFTNPHLVEGYFHWFKNQILTPDNPNDPTTWEAMLEKGWDCAYVAQIMEGPALPAAPAEADPGRPDPDESDYDAQNRYRKEHGCLAPEQR